MRMETDHRVLREGPPTHASADPPDFFDGADRARALRPPRRDEVSPQLVCPLDPPVVVVDAKCGLLDTDECSAAFVSLANPYGNWNTDLSPPPPRQQPLRVAPPSSMAGMVAAIHHVLQGRIDPLDRIEHRDLWQTYARTLIERADPLGHVVGRAVLGDPIATWFRGIDGAQQLGGLMRLGEWMDARWDRGLRIDLDGNQPGWTALERVATEFAFLRVVVHDLQPQLLHIVGETPRMQGLTFTNQNLDPLDLGWLERFGPLTALDVQGFTLRHLDPVRDHFRLEQLRVADCRGPVDLSVLEDNPELIDLHVAGCPISGGWTSLPRLKALRRLTVGAQAEWTEVNVIRDCAQVTDLRLVDLEMVRHLEPLPTLSSVEQLELRNLGIEHLDPVVELSALRTLTLSRNHQLVDIEALAECAQLEQLTIDRLMWVRDLTALTALPALTHLTLSKCRRLARLPKFARDAPLQELTLDGCPAVEDLAGVATLPQLTVVRLRQTSINTVRDFVAMPNLESVVLLEPARDRALQAALREARAVERPADDLAPGFPEARAYALIKRVEAS